MQRAPFSRRSAPVGEQLMLTAIVDTSVQTPVPINKTLQIFQPLLAVPVKSCRRNRSTLALVKPTVTSVSIRETKTSWASLGQQAFHIATSAAYLGSSHLRRAISSLDALSALANAIIEGCIHSPPLCNTQDLRRCKYTASSRRCTCDLRAQYQGTDHPSPRPCT